MEIVCGFVFADVIFRWCDTKAGNTSVFAGYSVVGWELFLQNKKPSVCVCEGGGGGVDIFWKIMHITNVFHLKTEKEEQTKDIFVLLLRQLELVSSIRMPLPSPRKFQFSFILCL